jgi:hypothetical protein
MREIVMGQRVSFRLDETLRHRLELEADAQKTTPSELVRQAVQRLLDRESLATTDRPLPPQSLPPIIHSPDTCAETLLKHCPVPVREAVRRGMERSRLSTTEIVRALLIAQVFPTVPQSSQR